MTGIGFKTLRVFRWSIFRLTQIITLPISMFIIILGWTFQKVSEENAYRISRIVIPLFFLPFHWLRLSNMRKVFTPLGWTHDQIKELNHKNMRYISDFIAEVGRLPIVTSADLEKKITFEGEEYLTTALSKGKGILLLNGHLGNWWYVRACLWLRHHSITAVGNKVMIVSVERHLQKIRSRFQSSALYITTGGSRAAQEVFEKNGIFSVYFDVAIPLRWKHSSWLPLGQARIHADQGPAKLALKYRPTVLMVTSIKINSTQYRVKLVPAPILNADLEAISDPQELHVRWLDELYQEILLYPEQWWNWGAVLLRTRPHSQP